MPGPPWGEDPPAAAGLLRANTRALLYELATSADRRHPPDVTVAHDWHRRIYRGVSGVPTPPYLGAFRGSSDPDLVDYDVVIADNRGRIVAQAPPAYRVGDELTTLQGALDRAVAVLDARIHAGTRPTTTGELEAVVLLAAQVHGEWIRIHPYANGNGRIARTWANWVALRYGMPPFVRIKPRPHDLLYARAAAQSMGSPPRWQGDHTTTYSYFLSLLRPPDGP